MPSVDITNDATWLIAMSLRERRMLAPLGVWRGLILACCRHRVLETPTGSLSPSQGALYSPPLWYRSAFYCLSICLFVSMQSRSAWAQPLKRAPSGDPTTTTAVGSTPPCRFSSGLDESASNRQHNTSEWNYFTPSSAVRCTRLLPNLTHLPTCSQNGDITIKKCGRSLFRRRIYASRQ